MANGSTNGKTAAERQRRFGAYIFLAVGVLNLVLGVLAGAAVTIGVSVFFLIVGGALLASTYGIGFRSPGR